MGQILHFTVLGVIGSQILHFVVLRVVWEPNSTFCCIRGCLGDKFCILLY